MQSSDNVAVEDKISANKIQNSQFKQSVKDSQQPADLDSQSQSPKIIKPLFNSCSISNCIISDDSQSQKSEKEIINEFIDVIEFAKQIPQESIISFSEILSNLKALEVSSNGQVSDQDKSSIIIPNKIKNKCGKDPKLANRRRLSSPPNILVQNKVAIPNIHKKTIGYRNSLELTLNDQLFSHLAFSNNKQKLLKNQVEIEQDALNEDAESQNDLNKDQNQLFQQFQQEIENNKKYMNLVVHDLRNPSEAISQSLNVAQDLILYQTNQIVSKLSLEFQGKFKENLQNLNELRNLPMDRDIQAMSFTGLILEPRQNNQQQSILNDRVIVNQSDNSSSSQDYSCQIDDQIISSDQYLDEIQQLEKSNEADLINQVSLHQLSNQKQSNQNECLIVNQNKIRLSQKQVVIQSDIKQQRGSQIRLVESIPNNNNGNKISDVNQEDICLLQQPGLINHREQALDQDNQEQKIKQPKQDQGVKQLQQADQGASKNQKGNQSCSNQQNQQVEQIHSNGRSVLEANNQEQPQYSSLVDQVAQDNAQIQQLDQNQSENVDQINSNNNINQELDQGLQQQNQNRTIQDLIFQILLDEKNQQRNSKGVSLDMGSYCDFTDQDVLEFITKPDKVQQNNNRINLGGNSQNKQNNNLDKAQINIPSVNCKSNFKVLKENEYLKYYNQIQNNNYQVRTDDRGTQTDVSHFDYVDIKKYQNHFFDLLKYDQFKQFLLDYSFFQKVISKLRSEITNQGLEIETINNLKQFIQRLFHLSDSLNPVGQHQQSSLQSPPSVLNQQENNVNSVQIIRQPNNEQPQIEKQQNINRIKSSQLDQSQNNKLDDQEQQQPPRKLMSKSLNQGCLAQPSFTPRYLLTSDFQNLSFSQMNENQISSIYHQAKICPQCEIYKNLIIYILNKTGELVKCVQTAQNFLKVAQSSSTMIQNLIDDLLDLAKIQKGAFILNYAKYDMISIIIEAFQTVQFKAEQKELKLILSLNTESPLNLDQVIIDKRRMMQILLNFLSNSIKFTKRQGYVKIELRILQEQIVSKKLDKQDICISSMVKQNQLPSNVYNSQEHNNINKDNYDKREFMAKNLKIQNQNSYNIQNNQFDVEKFVKIQLSIKDNGVGISDTKAIFKDYGCLKEHQSMNPSGTGLGLQICKNLIEQMGGSIRVESQPGKGTNFIIEMNIKVIDKQNYSNNDGDMNVIQNGIVGTGEKLLHQQIEFLKYFKEHSVCEQVSLQQESRVGGDPSSLDPNKDFVFKSLKEQGTSQVSEMNQKVIQGLQKFIKNIDKFQNPRSFESRSFDCLQLDQRSEICNPTQQVQLLNKSLKNYNSAPRKRNNSQLYKNVNYLLKNSALQNNNANNYNYYNQNGNNINYNKNKKIQNQSSEQVGPKKYESSPNRGAPEGSFQYKLYQIEQQVAQLTKKYKKRQLRVLVANDEPFQLLTITTVLLRNQFINKVDQAHNGQEALDFVKKNEVHLDGAPQSQMVYFYDFILLDLDMQIMDGFDACKKIREHYELLNRHRKLNQNNNNNYNASHNNVIKDQLSKDQHVQQTANNDQEILMFQNINDSLQPQCQQNQIEIIRKSQSLQMIMQQPEWLKDLIFIQQSYDETFTLMKDQLVKDKGSDDSSISCEEEQSISIVNENSQEQEKKILSEFQNLEELRKSHKSSDETHGKHTLQVILKVFQYVFYSVRYNAISQMKMPLIYALSATVDANQIQKTSQIGFFGFIQQPLTIPKLNQITQNIINRFTNTWIHNQLELLGISTLCIDSLLGEVGSQEGGNRQQEQKEEDLIQDSNRDQIQ